MLKRLPVRPRRRGRQRAADPSASPAHRSIAMPDTAQLRTGRVDDGIDLSLVAARRDAGLRAGGARTGGPKARPGTRCADRSAAFRSGAQTGPHGPGHAAEFDVGNRWRMGWDLNFSLCPVLHKAIAYSRALAHQLAHHSRNRPRKRPVNNRFTYAGFCIPRNATSPAGLAETASRNRRTVEDHHAACDGPGHLAGW